MEFENKTNLHILSRPSVKEFILNIGQTPGHSKECLVIEPVQRNGLWTNCAILSDLSMIMIRWVRSRWNPEEAGTTDSIVRCSQSVHEALKSIAARAEGEADVNKTKASMSPSLMLFLTHTEYSILGDA